MHRFIHWVLLFGCCEALPLTRWDSGTLWYLCLLLVLTAKQVLLLACGVPILAIMQFWHLAAFAFCLMQLIEALLNLRRDRIMEWSHWYSGTVFDGMLGFRGRFSLLLVEPAVITGLALLATNLPGRLDQSMPFLLALMVGFCVEFFPAMIPQAEWARLLLTAFFIPLELLAAVLKPFMQAYGPLVAFAHLYSIPVCVFLHNYQELHLEAQANQPAPQQTKTEQGPPPILFQAVRMR